MLSFTRSLVSDRLAACGQHILSIRSVYRWQETIEDEEEARVALHIALPVVSGNPAYIDWVLSETMETTDTPAGQEP